VPAGRKVYFGVDWRDGARVPGKLELGGPWKLTCGLAGRYQKRVGVRVMMSYPDITDSPLPEFLRNKIPMVKLGDWQSRTRYDPRYDDPAFQAAFRELVDLLAESYDGHADVEYVHTFLYGFWGEGHALRVRSAPAAYAV